MKKAAFKGNVVLPDKILSGGTVLVEEEKITGIHPHGYKLIDKVVTFQDHSDNYICPGLIDLHFHGALGKDVMDCNVESLKQIAFHQANCGVTGFLGTTVSSSHEQILKAIESIRKATKLPLPSEILGVHIEGPFLSHEKRGAHDSTYVRETTQEEVHHLLEAASGLRTILSMAPEVGRNMSFIKMLKNKGVIISIGHSNASYQQALDSFKEGISHATHLLNAMRELHPRDPGVVGAVFDSPEVTAEIIADGVHIHPSLLRLAVSRKGADKICLITDSLKAAGVGDGIYTMGNFELLVKGNEARIKDTGVLAGSVLTLNKAVKNILEWTGVEIHQAVNMASLNPARVLGLDNKIGSIQIGNYANLSVFDKEFNVVDTIWHGRSVL
jgi:N-acetylglucosamine-6-phosphate deacetylase